MPQRLQQHNELGLYDLAGNVWEWCEDWYGGEYYQECFEKGTVKDPTGPAKGAYRVPRGGSWSYDSGDCLPSARGNYWPAGRDLIVGFRPAFGPLAGSGGAGLP